MSAIKAAKYRPLLVEAAMYNGHMDEHEEIDHWLRARSARLVVDEKKNQLYLETLQGTCFLEIGWWIVYEDNQFEVYDDLEFDAKYEL